MVALIPNKAQTKAILGMTGGLLVGKALNVVVEKFTEDKTVPVLNVKASPVVKIVGGAIASTYGMSTGGAVGNALTLAGAEMVADAIVEFIEGFITPKKAEYIPAPVEITVTPTETVQEEKTVAPAEIYNVY